MKRINIKNFGAVKEATIDFDSQVNIIIGPQASGKSTISKLVFLVSLLGEWLWEICGNYVELDKTESNPRFKAYERLIRRNFRDTFGDFKSLGDFEVCAEWDEQHSLVLSNAGVYVGIDFSKTMFEELLYVMSEMDKYYAEMEEQEKKSFDIRQTVVKKHANAMQFFFGICPQYFNMDDPLYIPAGRSAFSNFSRKEVKDAVSSVDLSIDSFLNWINNVKAFFGNGIVSFVDGYRASNNLSLEKEKALDDALDIIKKVLRAEYIYSDNSESLRINDKTQIALRNASSGQQEILWPLILLLMQILGNYFPVIIFEEPEAHLYPEAQLQVMKLIALAVNETNCKVIITTHSPYILTSANLLIQSGNVENVIEKNVDECVIGKQYRLSNGMVNALKITNSTDFEIRSIIDDNSGLIEAYEIDTVSERINEISAKLLELEIKYGL